MAIMGACPVLPSVQSLGSESSLHQLMGLI